MYEEVFDQAFISSSDCTISATKTCKMMNIMYLCMQKQIKKCISKRKGTFKISSAKRLWWKRGSNPRGVSPIGNRKQEASLNPTP
jgi:hypothetical protein